MNINKSNIKLFFTILVLTIGALSVTYAFLNIASGEVTTPGSVAGCFEVDYTGTEINSADLASTTDYTQGAISTVSLSKDESCKIYTEASISIKTNGDNTTAPIDTVKALKYKVYLGDELQSEGVIDKLSVDDGDGNDVLLLDGIELTDEVKEFEIYIWVDSKVSGGEYNGTTYSGYIYAESSQTSTITGS